MTLIECNRLVVGEPNWHPLETVLTQDECVDFMYMGRAGEIELYKHRLTRRYLNISSDAKRFYQMLGESYIEISRAEALENVHS